MEDLVLGKYLLNKKVKLAFIPNVPNKQVNTFTWLVTYHMGWTPYEKMTKIRIGFTMHLLKRLTLNSNGVEGCFIIFIFSCLILKGPQTPPDLKQKTF